MSDCHSWYQVVIFLHRTALEAMLVFSITVPRLTANVVSWKQFDITFVLLLLVLHAVFVVEPTNNFNRLLWILLSVGFVLSTRHSFVNVWNCYWPIFCAFVTSTADGSAIWIAEKTRLVFRIVKLLALNSMTTSECLVSSWVMSWRWTEIQRA